MGGIKLKNVVTLPEAAAASSTQEVTSKQGGSSRHHFGDWTSRVASSAPDNSPVPISAGSGWRLGHRPSLDVLRGIAILAVLAGHFGVPGVPAGGSVGVAIFFALSGYLI